MGEPTARQLATRFQPGRSGNPNGRPRRFDITAALDDILAADGPDAKTIGRALLERLVNAAERGLEKGDPSCFNALAKYIGVAPKAESTNDVNAEIRVRIVECEDERPDEDGADEPAA